MLQKMIKLKKFNMILSYTWGSIRRVLCLLMELNKFDNLLKVDAPPNPLERVLS